MPVSSHQPSRRALLSVDGAASLTLLPPGMVRAQSGDTLKVGFVRPRTGPLGSFGEGDGHVLELARKALAAGLTIGGKKYKVVILDRD